MKRAGVNVEVTHPETKATDMIERNASRTSGGDAGLAVAALLTLATTAAGYVNKPADALPEAKQSPAAMLPADAERAFPHDEPLLTLLHYPPHNPKHAPEEEAIPFAERLGVNHVWGDLDAPFLSRVSLVNPSYRVDRALNEREWMFVYLRTPWMEYEEDPLAIDLLAGYFPRRFVLPKTVDSAMAVKVEERESRTFLSPDAYTVDPNAATLTLTGGLPGRSYRVLFLASDKGFNHLKKENRMANLNFRMADGTVPSVKARQFQRLSEHMETNPEIDVIRPTSEIFDRFDKMADPAAAHTARLPLHSRNAFWQGMSPARLERFEQRYGRPFDPRWIVDHGFGEFGFVPEEGYRQWIDLIRGELHVHVRERNNLVHERGRRVRVFYGDNFVGIAPHLGDIAHNGYDELVSGMDSGPGTVREITSFPGETRRIARFPWSGLAADSAELRTRFRANWRWMKRELLFRCTDGFTMGGLGTRLGADPITAAESERIFDDFRTVHDRVQGRDVFTHDGFNVYVLNAWGEMAAWNTKLHYMSQHLLHALLVDLPVNVRWISFDEVIEGGVPADAAVLLLCGEPGTAWGGGRTWRDETLLEAVRGYVENGGGLLTIGAPTLVDGKLALDDLLGVEYAGYANEDCEAHLWNINRWSMDGRDPATFPQGGVMPLAKLHTNATTMPPALSGALETQGAYWTVRYPARLRSAGAAVIAHEMPEDIGDGMAAWRGGAYWNEVNMAGSRTGVFARDAGRGRCVTIGGFGGILHDLFKPLLFYAAGRLDELHRLDSGSRRRVATYFYPDRKLLIAYNEGGSRITTDIRFDPALAGIDQGRVRLVSMDADIPSVERDAGALREGFAVTLQSGQAAYWTVQQKP
jgi:hypothetical protein